MQRTGKLVLGVLAGAVLWAVLWVGGTTGLAALVPEHMAPGQPLMHPGLLALLIAWSVVLSLLAGYTAARIGSLRAAWWLAGLQLVLGIAIEAASWSMTPVWYHVVFLALLVPATVQGGRLFAQRAGQAGAARFA